MCVRGPLKLSANWILHGEGFFLFAFPLTAREVLRQEERSRGWVSWASVTGEHFLQSHIVRCREGGWVRERSELVGPLGEKER